MSTVDTPDKATALLDRYFAVRARFTVTEMDQATTDKLKQVENYILEHGTPEHLIRLYIAKRDDKDAFKKEYEAKVDSTDAFLAAAESVLKRHLREQGLQSFAAADGSGTAFRKTMTSVTVKDKEQFRQWVKSDDDRWDYLDMKANKTAVVAFKESNDGALPDGIGWREEEVVQVRR